MEEWRTIIIDETPTHYEVSSYGKVRNSNSGRLLKLDDSNGYKRANIFINGKRKAYFVHRLVAMAFIPNPDKLPFINHKDEIKDNNFVDNLEWCTSQYNNTYGTRLERVSKSVSATLTGRPSSMKGKPRSKETCNKISKALKGKYTYSDNGNSRCIICLDLYQVFTSMREACDKFNCPPQQLTNTCKNRQRSCRGHYFMYYDEFLEIYNSYE